MSQINQPPIGLQSLLGSQNFGQNPSNLLQDVRPIVDLEPFWSAYRHDSVYLAGTTTTNTVGLLGQVPNGELWLITSVGAQLGMSTHETGASCSLGFHLEEVYESSSASNRYGFAGPFKFVAGAASGSAVEIVGVSLTRPFAVRSGEQVKFIVGNTTRTTGIFQWQVNARFIRLQV